MSHDRPTAPELAAAVAEFLEAEILPVLADQRLRFRVLVAVNALGILQRELGSPDPRDDAARLLEEVIAGRASLAELKEHVAAKVRVVNPGYLREADNVAGGE